MLGSPAVYEATRRAVTVARDGLWDLRFPLPKLRTVARQLSAPTLYFCAPDYDVPAGGMRVIYRHVDILNDAGIPAAVLHHRSGFRCSWFQNSTRVVGDRDAVIGPEDLVVVGELATSLLGYLGPRNRFVVLNQNPHLTWERVPEHEVAGYLNHPGLAAVLVVSQHSLEMVRYAAPMANVVRLHNSIDPSRFYVNGSEPGRVISYMPRRGLNEAQQVLGLLRGHRVMEGWEVRPLAGLSEDEVADELRSTTIFLSLAYHEGFGLPAAEAMACGAYAVGFHGFSGREYFRPEFSHPVEPGDVLALAHALTTVLSRERVQPGWCRSRAQAAAAFIAREYSVERERSDVVQTYSALLSG